MFIKYLKSMILKIIWQIGYQLIPNSGTRNYPVEFSNAERAIIDYVLDKELTMVNFDQLVSTVIACKWVVKNGIPGSFVECGVWRGGNAIVAAEIFRLNNSSNDVWLFDTFEGMVRPTDLDLDYSGRPALNEYLSSIKSEYIEWCYASLEDVKNNFSEKGLLDNNINFVKGNVNETLKEISYLQKIAVLRLDTDWYESTKIQLEVLYPKLSIGGCLIIDDYGAWQGCKAAVDEYFEKTAERPFFECSGHSGRVGIKLTDS